MRTTLVQVLIAGLILAGIVIAYMHGAQQSTRVQCGSAAVGHC